MFDTTDYYLASEIAYRHERVAQSWAAANRHRARRSWRRRRVALLPRLKQAGVQPQQRPTGRATVA